MLLTMLIKKNNPTYNVIPMPICKIKIKINAINLLLPFLLGHNIKKGKTNSSQ